MTLSSLKTIAPAIATTLVVASSASAGTNMAWSHVGYGGPASNHANIETVSLNGNNSRVYAGQMNWTLANTDNLITYCIELAQDVGNGGDFTEFAHTDDSYDALRTDITFDITTAVTLSAFWDLNHSNVVDNDTASAFQLGIWDIVYDNDKNLQTGAFKAASSTASIIADTWLSNTALLDLSELIAQEKAIPALTIYHNASLQDQIGPGPEGDIITVVPAPAAAGAGLIAMVGLVGRRRRSH